jgi:5,5'-dehydrodivanillate O-demethylase oxygenase subunit
MLTEEQNRLLTEVGPGKPMGNLLRRYWMPIGGASEFDSISVKPVRLMGEDLVLYKDLGGTYGLVDRHCPHRRADLSYGFVEDCGIRCNYHGWRFDERGRCVEQPFEDTAHPEANFKDKVRATAYPVRVLGGMLWAYMGPQPAPLLPNWEPFFWKDGYVQIMTAVVPCNWFQAQENAIDPVHFEWMHSNWSRRLKGHAGDYAKRHIRIDFREHDFGFTYHRLVEDMPEDHERWTTGRVTLWPNCLGPNQHFEWRVPIDDENLLFVIWHFTPVPLERRPYVQGRIPTWEALVKDPFTGKMLTTHIDNQDFIAWVGQGRISDRTKEHLGPSDRGITLMRKRFFDDLKRIERGEDPSGIIRDPSKNVCIELPIASRSFLLDSLPLEEMLADPSIDPRQFITIAGIPDDVRIEMLAAIGLDEKGERTGDGAVHALLTAGSAGAKSNNWWS